MALLGLAVAFRPTGSLAFRRSTAASFALLAGLVGAPMVAHGLPQIWTLYLPLMLLLWATLPITLTMAAVSFIDRRAEFRIGWSLLPAICALALVLIVWTLPHGLRHALLVGGEIPEGSMLGAAIGITAFALVLITAFVWLAAIVRMFMELRTYNERLLDLYSNADQFEIRWLGPIFALLGAFALVIVLLVLNDNLLGLPALGPASILAGCTGVIFLLVVWLCYATPPPQIDQSDPKPKYARALLTDELAERISIRLDQAMAQELTFLDPLLSLQSLARQIAVPANQLSRYLNERSALSFFDYINQLRAQHARNLMLLDGCNVLDAAFASGFNSKSTFYKAFQREFGQSPANYMREQLRLVGYSPNSEVEIAGPVHDGCPNPLR